MSEQVRRYDYGYVDDGNGSRYLGLIERDTGKLVRHDDYDALQAEAEALRVVLHEIASVNPAERGIEWAKSYASDGLKGAGSELYARWLETFKEAEALRAQRNKMAQILRDLVPGCKWRIMRPRIDQALQEVDGGY